MIKDLFKSKAQKQAELDIEKAHSKLQSFNSTECIKVSSARKLLQHANIALRAKDWKTVSRLSDLCIKKIEDFEQEYKHASVARDSAKSILLSANTLPKEVDSQGDISKAEELFKKAESTFESGEYNVAEELYNSVKELVEQIIKKTEDLKETEKLKETENQIWNYYETWKYQTEDEIYDVAVTPDGSRIVAGSKDHNVYVFDENGNLQWKYKTDCEVYRVIITNSKVIAGSLDDYLYVFDANGNLQWKYKIDKLFYDIAINGSRVVVGSYDDYVYVFDENGNLQWKYKTGYYKYYAKNAFVGSVAITPNGSRVVVGSNDYKVYVFDENGNLQWKYKTDCEVHKVSVSDECKIVIVEAERNLYVFDENGILKWKYQNINSATISPDGSTVVANSNDTIHKFDENGNLQWKYKIDGEIHKVSVTPDCSLIVFVSKNVMVYVLDENGNLKWNTSLSNTKGTPYLAITKNGFRIVIACGNYVYVFDSEKNLLQHTIARVYRPATEREGPESAVLGGVFVKRDYVIKGKYLKFCIEVLNNTSKVITKVKIDVIFPSNLKLKEPQNSKQVLGDINPNSSLIIIYIFEFREGANIDSVEECIEVSINYCEPI